MTQATPVTEATLTVEQIETAIDRLSTDDFNRLRPWFAEKADEMWDRQLKEDVAAGRLDAMAAEALADLDACRCTDL